MALGWNTTCISENTAQCKLSRNFQWIPENPLSGVTPPWSRVTLPHFPEEAKDSWGKLSDITGGRPIPWALAEAFPWSDQKMLEGAQGAERGKVARRLWPIRAALLRPTLFQGSSQPPLRPGASLLQQVPLLSPHRGGQASSACLGVWFQRPETASPALN